MTDADLTERLACLLDDAVAVAEAVTTRGWTPMAAADTLATIDTLTGALGVLGASARDALGPVTVATDRLRALIAATPHQPPTPLLSPRVRRGGSDRYRDPQYWLRRDARVAEQLWVGEQRPTRWGDLFAALPPAAMVEAVTRRHRGEHWHAVLQDLAARHSVSSPPET
ncbi:hypothetical protein [Streptomyces sp. NPDC049879]|uniref:hypothetical protein n=1 Tax=Streptomyces sp. NPDC049879 TaxID=3365598 RepID=UPI0037BB5980